MPIRSRCCVCSGTLPELITTLAVILGLLFTAVAGSASAAEPVSLDTLLNEMVDRDHLARLPDPAYTTAQASSYDRHSVAPDKPGWFANHDWDNCIREQTIQGRKEYVLMDADGPGAIVRFWKGGNDPTNRLRIYLDGSETPVIDEVADAWLGGQAWVSSPLAAVTARGINLALPIPYAKHCLVTLDRLQWDWYNIEYRTYASGTAVTSFTRQAFTAANALVQHVSTLLEGTGAGVAPLQEAPPSTRTLEPGANWSTTVQGPAALRHLSLAVTGLSEMQALRSTVLSISCDGEPCVWGPVGEFFGSGVGLNPYHDWCSAAQSDGTLNSWWIMPFETSCTISVSNIGHQPVILTIAAVGVGPWSWDERSMHFHSTWRQQYPIATKLADGTQDWNYVTIHGQGVYLGDALVIHNLAAPGTNYWWGEGDEKIFVDGENFPSHFGTGSEDYYGYAWGDSKLFNAPFHAQTRAQGNLGTGYTCDTRIRVLDAIPFQSNLDLSIEIWHWMATEVAYAATTYWYARPGATSNRPPLPEEAGKPVPPAIAHGGIEGEECEISACSGGKTSAQNNPRWSDGRQLLWVDGHPGDSLDLILPIPTTGNYRLAAKLTKAKDYGIVQFFLDGKELSGPVDGYDPAIVVHELPLGVSQLAAGPHVLSVRIVGANKEAAPGFLFGLDRIAVVPAP